MNLDPSSHVFDEQDLTVSVGTNNPTGYQLTVSTVGDSNTLVNTADNTKTIPNLSTSYSVADFPVNYWGYRISGGSASSGNYGQFTSGSMVSESDSAVNDITKTLGFGAKIDYTKPSGLYQLDLNFTAVANPVTPYMQNLDSTLCTTMLTIAIDSRDGQEYIIQRLADGNCWMMTNLNLGAATLIATKFDHTNTNLPNDSTKEITASTFSEWKKASGTSTYTAAEYIPVSGTDSKSQTPYATLYNYCAASAGTICTNSNSSDASYDICPAGWRLPTGGSSGEFKTLYGIYNTYAKMRNPIASGGAAFALAGEFSNSTPTLQGSNGRYWSSTRYDNAWMYRLDMDASQIFPSDYNLNSRNIGSSIRCILSS